MRTQKGSILLIILLLLAGAGLIFVGYKYVYKSNNPKTITPSAYPVETPGSGGTITPAPYPLETIDPTANWKTYTNEKYQFEIKYPKNYQVLTDKNNLYGWPNAVALIYDGGQSYDIPVEVWDSEKAYQDKYKTQISDLTIFKSENKFITLLDSTKEADNAKIISTFKFLNQKNACQTNGGIWDEQYQECGGITKEVCGKIGGEWVECGSPCRHEPNAKYCIQSCALYCQL